MSEGGGFMSFINMYPTEHVPLLKESLAVSMMTFFLVMILQSIEMSTFIKDMGILEIERLKRTSIVFAYISGYYFMFFKIILALFVVFGLINVIGWAIIGMAQLLGGGSQGGGALSAAHLLAGGGADIGGKMKTLAKKTAMFFFGILFLKKSLLTFLFIMPLIIIVFVIMFSDYLDKEIIEDRHEEEKTRIATTNHNFIVYLITTMYVAVILYLCIPYLLIPLSSGDS
jgi:uncharacterized membrane protein